MKWSIGVIVIPLILCLYVGIVSGILCYQCNSNTERLTCGATNADKTHLRACNETRYNLTASMCRKITQSVDKLLGMEENERTIRTCGYVKPHRESYYRAGFGSRQLVVTCYEDGCNTAPAISMNMALLLSTTGAIVAILL